MFGFGFGGAFALYGCEQQTGVGGEFGGFEAVETRALAGETGEAGDEAAVAVDAEALDLAGGGRGCAAEPGAGGKGGSPDGFVDQCVPGGVFADVFDFVDVGHGKRLQNHVEFCSGDFAELKRLFVILIGSIEINI